MESDEIRHGMTFETWLRAAGHYQEICEERSNADVAALRAAWFAGESPDAYVEWKETAVEALTVDGKI